MKCPSCGKTTSVWNRDIASGRCGACQQIETAKIRAAQAKREEQYQRQVKAEQEIRATTPPKEPATEPVDGQVLIGLSVLTAIIGGILLAVETAVVFGIIVLGIAGMLYLAGVIRWAVSGSQFLQLNRIQRQNVEIIELLKLIATKRRD